MSGALDAQAEVDRLRGPMIKRDFYVMFRRVVDPERLKSAMLAHYRWIIGLEKQGAVFASGPLFKQEGGPGVGMTVFRAADFAAAEALAAGDPFCQGGGATFHVERWQINEGRVTVAADFSDQTYRFE